MKKIIFLDVDGVLINRAACASGFGKVAPECVQQLNDLLQRTGAFIVVSSCWRIGRCLAELKDLFNEWHVIPGRILDRTPHLLDEKNNSKERGHEIQAWLDLRKEYRDDVESFVIIDDDADMVHLLPYLVQTDFEPGFTAANAERAAQILEKGI